MDGYIVAILLINLENNSLHAYKSGGKTKYKPVIGKAVKILSDKKILIKAFNNIDTVQGVCENCGEETILVGIVTELL